MRHRADSACKRFNILRSSAYHPTHLYEAVIDDRRQSFPKFSYGLAGYGRTIATRLFILVLKVVDHGDVEFSEIEKVRGYRYRLNVLIKPSRDLRRTELRAAYTYHRAANARL